jgi:hypothetical protein
MAASLITAYPSPPVIDEIAVAIGDELAPLIQLMPEHLWSDVYSRCHYGGLTHATYSLSSVLQHPILSQLLILRGRNAARAEMAHLVIEWQDAALLCQTIDCQPIEFIHERLAQVVSLNILNHAIHRQRFYGVTDRDALNATVNRFNELLATPEL